MLKALIGCGVAVLNLVFIVGVGILVMLYGWGLEAKSWPVILGGYFAIGISSLITALVQAAVKD